MNRVLGLAAAFGLVLLVRPVMPMLPGDAGGVAMAFGFVLTVSFFLGQGITRLGLPSITGYLLVGMVFGPYLFRTIAPPLMVLGPSAVQALQLLDEVALGLIALSAGGELKLAAVRTHLRSILAILAAQSSFVFCAAMAMLLLVGQGMWPLQQFQGGLLLASILLLSVTALANSPATALAIIQEYRAKGPVAEIVLGVTVVKDVVVITAFTIVLSISIALAGEGQDGGAGAFLSLLAWEVLGSIGAGVLLGWVVEQYLRRLGEETPLVVLGVAFAASTLLPGLHLSGLLACIVAGFYIENFSEQGDALLQAVERHSLPVYVVFFTIAGARLDLDALWATLPLTLLLAGTRLLATAGGTALGGALGRAPASVTQHAWSGFAAQAGVTIGFALLIDARFAEIGGVVKTLVLAGVAVNQIAGPILFRLGLSLAGETQEAEG